MEQKPAPAPPPDDARLSPWAIAGALVATLVFGAYLYLSYASPSNQVVIGFPRRSVLLAGQVGMTLMHTDILAQNGMQAEFIAPEEMAQFRPLTDHIAHVLLTGEADPLVRMANGMEGKIVATLGSGGRMAFTVPHGSSIDSIADLEGKRVAGTPGNALHRWMLEELGAAGVGPDAFTMLTYQGPTMVEQGEADAYVLWDPYLVYAEERLGLTKLAQSEYFLSVFFSQSFIDERREEAVATLAAIKQALWYVSQNPRRANAWWASERGAQRAAHLCSMINPRYRARDFSEIVLSPNLPSYRRSLEKDAAFLSERGLVDAKPDVDRSIDASLMLEADELAQPLQVQVTAQEE